MNVFVLNTGRCGSTTFIRACAHIRNYTAGHETRVHCLGSERLAYPDWHIEADNRLSWMLGRLDAQYGKRAFYVHLRRDPEQTARSFARRRDFGIMRAWREGVLLGGPENADDLALARDYIDALEANICHFLRDKPHRLEVCLESVQNDFVHFWHAIGAQGDLSAALAEWSIRYNASLSTRNSAHPRS